MKRERKIKKKVETKLLIALLVVLFIINYPFLNNLLKNFLDESQTAFAERVIDGDTIDIGNESVRLLGINTPERGEQGYEEAKEFLGQLVLGKNVTLEFVGERQDKYGRILAYVFLNNTNINVKMIENGFEQFNNLILVTHVSPFKEACYYKNQIYLNHEKTKQEKSMKKLPC